MSRKSIEPCRIMVVDDEENLRHMLAVMLEKEGYRVELAANGKEALELAIKQRFDFILCDIQMPVMDGTEFVGKAVAANVTATIIMMSAYGSVDTAIACMQLGAYDYIAKPFKRDEIVLVLKKAEERERLKLENRQLKAEISREFSFQNIVSKNPRMQEIFALVSKVSDVKTTVLILGESGTGKELIARAIHYNGVRRNAPFVAINCGAIPENLLESELFGHVKGAFTDARADKAGLFEQADGGTLFLDEIGEMPLALQVKLLRVLQESEIRRVGAGGAQKVDVRVISATAKELAKEVTTGRFREDLYYRLNVFSIALPPLRERLEDIPLLVEHLLAKHGEKMGRTGVRPDHAAMQALLSYNWPGNVRELENCIERALVLCEGMTIGVECLPETLRPMESSAVQTPTTADSYSIKRGEEELERVLIRKALEKTAGNRTHAARLLEISHRALLYKLKEYGMD